MKRMWLLLIFIFAGCADGRRDQALSQVNVAAERIAVVGEDGWFVKENVLEVDPWGNQLSVRYTRKGSKESLVVWSDGKDGLPYTSDDIGSIRLSVDSSKERRKRISGNTEAVTSGAMKGIIKGAVQGWKDRNKDE